MKIYACISSSLMLCQSIDFISKSSAGNKDSLSLSVLLNFELSSRSTLIRFRIVVYIWTLYIYSFSQMNEQWFHELDLDKVRRGSWVGFETSKNLNSIKKISFQRFAIDSGGSLWRNLSTWMYRYEFCTIFFSFPLSFQFISITNMECECFSTDLYG